MSQPSTEVATRQSASTSRYGNAPRKTVYATVTDAGSNRYTYLPRNDQGGGDGGGGGPSMARRLAGQPIQQVRVPKNVPQFLGNARIIGYAWLAAMIMIGFDEWHNNGILPRPKRLWGASLVYGVLALVGMVDAMVPIANAFAIGYLIMLIWQFYNGQGQFSGESATKNQGGTSG
jgi:hypothetical protein